MIAFLDSLGRNDYDMDGDGEVTVADYLSIVANAGDTDVSPDEPQLNLKAVPFPTDNLIVKSTNLPMPFLR